MKTKKAMKRIGKMLMRVQVGSLEWVLLVAIKENYHRGLTGDWQAGNMAAYDVVIDVLWRTLMEAGDD